MFKYINLNLLGITFIVVVVLCAGLYFYVQLDNKRFMAEHGELPQFTTASEPTSEPASEPTGEIQSDKTQIGEQDPPIAPTEFVSGDSVEERIPLDEETSTAQTDISEPTSEFDATPLLSAFGLPEEVTDLLNEDADAADFEHAETHLTQAYGQSPEVEAILDKLKQMSGGRVKLDDLTELFEAWIQVLPEGEQESRRQLMDVLTQLYQAKALGSNGEVSLEVQVITGDASDD